MMICDATDQEEPGKKNMNIEKLNTDFGIADHIKFIEGAGGFPFIKVDNDRATAVISVYAGQVLSYQPANEPHDLMFLSEAAYYQAGKGIKGGAPICWPWFGPDPERQGRPAHGFCPNPLLERHENRDKCGWRMQGYTGSDRLAGNKIRLAAFIRPVTGNHCRRIADAGTGNAQQNGPASIHHAGVAHLLQDRGYRTGGDSRAGRSRYVDKTDNGIVKVQTGRGHDRSGSRSHLPQSGTRAGNRRRVSRPAHSNSIRGQQDCRGVESVGENLGRNGRSERRRL